MSRSEVAAIGQTVAEIWRSFYFSKWRLPPSWIFKRSEFKGSNGLRGPICVTVPNFVVIGDFFLIFQDGVLDFEKTGILRSQGQEDQNESSCQISGRLVKSLLRYGHFSIFQDGGRPPSWICFARVLTTHEEYLVVFIAVQNLAGIGVEVLKTCCFNIMSVWLANAYSRPFWCSFLG